MSKVEIGNQQYIVYTDDEEQALLIIAKELSRFDLIKYSFAEILIENGGPWKNFMDNTSDERLNIQFNDNKSLIFDEDSQATGKVRQQKIDNEHVKIDEDGYYLYELAYRYPNIDGYNANYRLAHEIARLLLAPSNPDKQIYDKETRTTQISGLVRIPGEDVSNLDKVYGSQMQESTINLLAQLAVREKHSADDIISGKIDLSESVLYKKCDELVKLLVLSMRNDFYKEMSFEQLMKRKIDYVYKYSDGTEEPANTFFYGILNDSSIIQKDFDKYMGKGAWRQLDSAMTQLRTANMSKEKENTIFEAIQKLIVQYANVRMNDKHKQAVLKNRNSDVPGIENKMKMIQEVTGIEMTTLTNSNLDFTVSKFGEIMKKEAQLQSKTVLAKHKLALFFKKYNIFMRLNFIEKFVNKELRVFPVNKQSEVEKIRKDFARKISNNGQYRNLSNASLITELRKNGTDKKNQTKLDAR